MVYSVGKEDRKKKKRLPKPDVILLGSLLPGVSMAVHKGKEKEVIPGLAPYLSHIGT